MNKIFIDAGAHDSVSARIWRKIYDPENNYMIYSFEPEPEFKHRFEDIPDCVLIPKAVWIEDCKLTFYRDGFSDIKAGGTIVKEKKVADPKYIVEVDAIDLSSWIKDNFKKDDEIILKLDIEGAEYQVIPKLAETGVLEYINKLSVEWHNFKLNNFDENLHKRAVKTIKNIPVLKWPRTPRETEKILGKGYYKWKVFD